MSFRFLSLTPAASIKFSIMSEPIGPICVHLGRLVNGDGSQEGWEWTDTGAIMKDFFIGGYLVWAAIAGNYIEIGQRHHYENDLGNYEYESDQCYRWKKFDINDPMCFEQVKEYLNTLQERRENCQT